MIEINTHSDALRHTAKRIMVAVSMTAAMSLVSTIVLLGTDMDASVRIGYVVTSTFCVGVGISALLTGALTYRSALLMRELTLTRTELFRLSRTDQLTGLLNRRGFDEAATAALEKAHQGKLPAVAMMCDIDRFKVINDEYGHEFGDRVLVQIGEVLRVFANDNGLLVARHGGEEFAIMAIGLTNEQAMIYAEALRQGCCAREVSNGVISISITVSIGLAAPQGETDLSKIMRIADQALYTAKHCGRNRVSRAEALSSSLAA
jgi:diguanylate cyclase (GGDEF)-like protein